MFILFLPIKYNVSNIIIIFCIHELWNHEIDMRINSLNLLNSFLTTHLYFLEWWSEFILSSFVISHGINENESSRELTHSSFTFHVSCFDVPWWVPNSIIRTLFTSWTELLINHQSSSLLSNIKYIKHKTWLLNHAIKYKNTN